jgi:curved DNA-binding protein CbpA
MNHDVIGSHTKTSNYFTTLELSTTATSEEIKKQYLQLVKQYHPDTFRHHQLSQTEQLQHEKRFKDIAEAYSVLKDDALRASYKGELEAIIRLRDQGKPYRHYATMSRSSYDPFDSEVDSDDSRSKRGFWGKFDGFKGYGTTQTAAYNETSTTRSMWYQSTQRSFNSFFQLTKLFILPFVATGFVLFAILHNNQHRTEQRRLSVEESLSNIKKRERTSNNINRKPDNSDTGRLKGKEKDPEMIDAWFNERYVV